MLVEDQQEIVQEETKICTVLFASCIDHIVETLVCVCVCVCGGKRREEWRISLRMKQNTAMSE